MDAKKILTLDVYETCDSCNGKGGHGEKKLVQDCAWLVDTVNRQNKEQCSDHLHSKTTCPTSVQEEVNHLDTVCSRL